MNIPDYLQDLQDDERPASKDALARLRSKVMEARIIELEIQSLEERIKGMRRDLERLYYKELPDLMDEIGVEKIKINDAGNMGSFEAKAQPYYSASIAANWDAERRAKAFAYLAEVGAGDLIKTKVEIDFARDERDEAVAFADDLEASGLNPSVKEAVHSATLTAWLKEQVEHNQFVPDLEKIGGTVGRVVKIKTTK